MIDNNKEEDNKSDEIVYIANFYNENDYLTLSPKPELDDFDSFLISHGFEKVDIGMNDDYDYYQFFSWIRRRDQFSCQYIIELTTINETIITIYAEGMSDYIKALKDLSVIYHNLVFTKSERDRIEDILNSDEII